MFVLAMGSLPQKEQIQCLLNHQGEPQQKWYHIPSTANLAVKTFTSNTTTNLARKWHALTETIISKINNKFHCKNSTNSGSSDVLRGNTWDSLNNYKNDDNNEDEERNVILEEMWDRDFSIKDKSYMVSGGAGITLPYFFTSPVFVCWKFFYTPFLMPPLLPEIIVLSPRC